MTGAEPPSPGASSPAQHPSGAPPRPARPPRPTPQPVTTAGPSSRGAGDQVSLCPHRPRTTLLGASEFVAVSWVSGAQGCGRWGRCHWTPGRPPACSHVGPSGPGSRPRESPLGRGGRALAWPASRSAGGISLFPVERENVQKRTFTRWINLHLEKVSAAPGLCRHRLPLRSTGGFLVVASPCVPSCGHPASAFSGRSPARHGGHAGRSVGGCPCSWGSRGLSSGGTTSESSKTSARCCTDRTAPWTGSK